MPETAIKFAEQEKLFTDRDFAWLVETLEEHVDENVFDALNKIVATENEDECMEYASNIVAEDTTGLAHLFLASKIADADEKKHHYEKALEQSSKYLSEYSPVASVFGHSTVGLATLLWSLQQHDEAIQILESADVDDLEAGPNLIDGIRFALVTYLIIQNKDERARLVLDGEAVPTFEWYYLNALLRFRQHGDTFVTRGALKAAFGEEDLVAHMLLDTEYNTEHTEKLRLELCPKNYIELTRECWNATPDAVAWLSAMISRGVPKAGQAEKVDQVRSRRLENEFELAFAHLERSDFKSAKRSLNLALREANRLNDGGTRFFSILELFTCVLKESDDSPASLIDLLGRRLAWLDDQAAKTEPEALMHSYLDIADAYLDNACDIKAAEVSAQKAYDILKKLPNTSDSHTEGMILRILGTVASTKNDFATLETRMRTAIANYEQSHGLAHLQILDALQFLRYALHHQGKHDEEFDIAKRIYAIDIHADKDESYDEMDWCEVERFSSENIKIIHRNLHPSD